MSRLKTKEDADDAAFAKANSIGTPAGYAKLTSLPTRKVATLKEARRMKAQIEELKRKWPAGKELRDCPDCPTVGGVSGRFFHDGFPGG